MNCRRSGFLAFLSASLACAPPDGTITRGADGEREWARNLAAAIPLGISGDSAQAVMERNGFRCHTGADSVVYLWCDKYSGGRAAVVRRRWQAVLNLDDGRRVFEARASTGLIGP
jgi:hypothetical protein